VASGIAHGRTRWLELARAAETADSWSALFRKRNASGTKRTISSSTLSDAGDSPSQQSESIDHLWLEAVSLVEEVRAVERALEVRIIFIFIHLHHKTLVPFGSTSIDCPAASESVPNAPDVKARLPLDSSSEVPRKDE
jgi:hypothetical protein